jgi:hypothetical protein
VRKFYVALLGLAVAYIWYWFTDNYIMSWITIDSVFGMPFEPQVQLFKFGILGIGFLVIILIVWHY